jgi:hypothetical protein
MDQASGSAKKVHVAQLILSIARAIGDIDKNKAVISVLKNRSGKSGKIFNNVKFDNGTSTISCDEVQEFDDSLAWDEKAAELQQQQTTKLFREINAKKDEIISQKPESQGPVEGNFVGVIKPNDNF